MKKTGCKTGHMRIGNKCVKKACSDAIHFFGLTDDTHCGFWILPDGRMLDGCYDKKNRDKTQFYEEEYEYYDKDNTLSGNSLYDDVISGNCHAVDHFDVSVPMGYDMDENESWHQFMRDCHAVRIAELEYCNRFVAQTEFKPTDKQIQTIVRAIMEKPGIGFLGIKGEEEGIRYDNARPLDVQRWVSRCWP